MEILYKTHHSPLGCFYDREGREVIPNNGNNFVARLGKNGILVIFHDVTTLPGHGDPSRTGRVPMYINANGLVELTVDGTWIDVPAYLVAVKEKI